MHRLICYEYFKKFNFEDIPLVARRMYRSLIKKNNYLVDMRVYFHAPTFSENK